MFEGMGRILNHVKILGSLKGLLLHNHTPITHQHFVDNNLLMWHPSIQEAKTLKQILTTFSKSSGMIVNKEKSEIFSSTLQFPLRET